MGIKKVPGCYPGRLVIRKRAVHPNGGNRFGYGGVCAGFGVSIWPYNGGRLVCHNRSKPLKIWSFFVSIVEDVHTTNAPEQFDGRPAKEELPVLRALSGMAGHDEKNRGQTGQHDRHNANSLFHRSTPKRVVSVVGVVPSTTYGVTLVYF